MSILIALFARLGVAERFRKALASITVGLLVAALVGGLWLRGSHYRDQRDVARMAIDITAANYARAAAERKAADLANVNRVEAETDTISKDTVDDYKARIAALRADFAERVRIATAAYTGGAGRAGVPGLSSAAGRTDASACETGLPARDALIASEQAEQLIALQDWVRRVAEVDTNGN